MGGRQRAAHGVFQLKIVAQNTIHRPVSYDKIISFFAKGLMVEMKRFEIDLKKIFILLLFLVVSAPAFGYETAPVERGGFITGRVALHGPIPEPRVFPMVLYPFGDFCKKISDAKGLVDLKELNVDDGGGLQDTVIDIKEISKGKGFRSDVYRLVSFNCMLHPAYVPVDEQFEVREWN